SAELIGAGTRVARHSRGRDPILPQRVAPVAHTHTVPVLSAAFLVLVSGARAPCAEKTELVITARYKDEAAVKHVWGADAEITIPANKWANRPADRVYFGFQKKGNKPEEYATIEFSTEHLDGKALRPGAYSFAQRAAFAPEGAPGIDI